MSGRHSHSPTRPRTFAGTDREQFAVVCRCGWASRGERSDTALEVECDGCGARQFVLPIDIFPQFDSTPSSAVTAEPPQLPTKKMPALPGDPPTARRAPKVVASRNSKAEASTDEAATHGRRWITPLRLVIAAGVLLLAITGIWTLVRSSDRAAQRAFKQHADTGLGFVADGEYHRAVPELRAAVDLLETLDRDDNRAREVRQMLRESEAITGLVPRSLFRMLSEFEASVGNAASSWESRFADDFADRWIVLETSVRRASDDSGDVVIDFPLQVGAATVRIAGVLPILLEMLPDDQPRTVIVAVQLESCVRSDGASPVWSLRLQSDTAFLWTNIENLRALGFDTDANADDEIPSGPSTAQLLADQAEVMGVTR